MKKLMVATLVSLMAMNGIASAKSLHTRSNIATIKRNAPGVDVSILSDSQILIVLQIIGSSKGAGDARTRVRAFLRPTKFGF